LNLKRRLKPHLPDLADTLVEINRVLLDKRRITETMEQHQGCSVLKVLIIKVSYGNLRG
jgi:hypothetical protein